MSEAPVNHWAEYKSGEGFLSYLRNSSHARNYCRDQIRHLISTSQARSMIEIGVGGRNEMHCLADFFRAHPTFQYVGTDWTPQFIAEAQAEFPDFKWKQLDIVTCKIEEWMKSDIVYSQHVLEHCPGLNPPLRNMLLMAKKVVINIFFQPPTPTEEINWSQYPVYHNFYSREHIAAVCAYHGFEPHLYAFNNADMPDAHECQNEVVLIAIKK